MKILVIGGGGREHALVWSLARETDEHEIFCAPGNAGTAMLATNLELAAEDIDGLLQWALEEKPDLTVVGPEAPLCAGLVDRFTEKKLTVFGPSQAAAQLEGSKQFAKEIMRAAGVPTARSECYDSADKAIEGLAGFACPVVVKADGLAAGKGVVICESHAEAAETIREIVEGAKFGDSGARVLIEEFLTGEEASLLGLVDGERVILLPSSQDHKRVFDGDMGPNTGGMGAYSPAPIVSATLEQRALEEIFKPVVAELARRGIEYRGVLYAGLMVEDGEAKVLEFNCRFGDPETQVVLPRVEGNLSDKLLACAEGRLNEVQLEVKDRSCAAVVMAAPGYPDDYPKGAPIGGLAELASEPDTVVFHAGTAAQDGEIVTNGGRVLAVTALGESLAEAVERAYRGVDRITFEGAHFRRDIAFRALDRVEIK